jgi:HlyD family secretion protein
MKMTFVVLAVLGLAAGSALFYRTHTTASPTITFRTVPVKRGDLVAVVSATGTLEPEEVVDVGSQVNGPIASLGKDTKDPTRSIDYDSQVDVGTLLAKVDDSVYKAQYDQAKANLVHAQADLGQLQAHLEQAEAEWKRAEALLPMKAIADTDYDLDVANYKAAKANLEVGKATIGQAEAALTMAKRNLDYCTITSPVKGVIIDRRVNVGQTVVSSMTVSSMFLIAKDLKRIQVWASVNEADIGRIHLKMPVTFTVDAFPNETFHGTVYQIRMNATMTQNVVTYTVVVETDNSDLRLLPYLTANVSFQVEQCHDVLKVPNSALRWKPRPQMVAPEYRDSLASTSANKGGNQPVAGASSNAGATPSAAGESKTPPDPKAIAAANHAHQQAAAQQPNAAKDSKTPVDGKKIKPRVEHGVVWVQDDMLARPIKVRIGATDGIDTVISGSEVKEGMEVIIGEMTVDQAADVANPFAPKLFNKSGGAAKTRP